MIPAAILFGAGVLQGFCGFGYSLMALPLLLFLLPAREAVPLLCVTGLGLNATLLATTRKHLQWRNLPPLFVAGGVFTPLGALLVREVSAAVAKPVLGTLVVLASVSLLLRGRQGFAPTSGRLFAAGTLSGLLNGFSTFSAPPVILLLAGGGMERDRIRSTLAAYFLFLGIIGGLSYGAMGLLTLEDLPGMAILLPVSPAGALVGGRLSAVTSSDRFRNASLLILAVLGGMTALT